MHSQRTTPPANDVEVKRFVATVNVPVAIIAYEMKWNASFLHEA